MFSQNLKRLRLESSLTQTQIAKQLNISQQQYQAWESGKRKPTLSTLEVFSKFFNVSIEELISDKPPSLERILSSETITFKGIELSEEQLEDLKQVIKDFEERNLT